MDDKSILDSLVKAYRNKNFEEVSKVLEEYDFWRNGYRLVEDYAEIPLSQGYVAKVSLDDLDLVLKTKWFATVEKDGRVNVKGKIKGKSFGLARLLLGISDSKIIADHINRDTLDNRNTNLRKANKSESAINRKGWKRSDKTGGSDYKGVYRKSDTKWTSVIKVNKKTIYLGSFYSEKEAAMAYNNAVDKYHGEFGFKNEI